MWKKASELFREVDPGLTVVSGRRRNKKRAVSQPPPPSPYQPHIATAEDWEAAKGVDCPRCGEETFHFSNGVCDTCYAAEQKKIARKIELRARVRNLSSIFRERRRASGR